ncbi:site-2 protease family protein [Prochlorococcus marinus]|uniref:site-2 protease family protein n=1 Tax=Prochlorococcus marinus TaxID=1219 RepID=UPI0022B44B6B|nr:site-2 protease family protein [Prochlorococcus marinus]
MASVELIRIKGIPLRVHSSWFFILSLFAVASQGQFARVFEGQFPMWQSWCIGFLGSLCLFLSVLLHELGHFFMALKEGVKVYEITLFLLGGITKVDKEYSTPMAELRVAVAGPLVSLFLSVLFLGIVFFSSDLNPILSNLFTQIGSINLGLAVLNLMPGVPLDGSLILKSLVWYFTGSQQKGQKAANATTRVLSFLGILLGILVAFSGVVFFGLWLIIISWFGFTSSQSQDQIIVLQEALIELRVKDASRKRFRVLEQDQSLRALSELKLKSSQQDEVTEWVLLCSSGRWVGYITGDPLKDLEVQYWNDHLLSDYKKPLSDLPSISEKSPLWEAVIEIERSKEQKLLVFNLAGLPSGTVDKVDISELILRKIGLNLPKAFLETARKKNIYPLGISLLKIVEGMIAKGLVVKK